VRGSATGSTWLRFGGTETLDCGGQQVSLTWDRTPFALPFSVTLDNFDIAFHPGSMRPAQYASHIRVRDAAGQESKTTISMNQPLDHAGFRMFQSSYRRGENGAPDTTILTVSHDPGVPVVYPSFVLLILGVAWYLVGSGRRKLTPAVPAPIPEPVRVATDRRHTEKAQLATRA